MAIIDRIGTIIRANINEIIAKAEDPEKIINQTLMDMRQAQYEARMEVARAIAEGKKIERDYLDHEEQAEQWLAKAEQALKADREDLAREALRRKQTAAELASGLKEQFDMHGEMIAKLKRQLRTLDAKIEESERKRSVLIARQKRAEASKNLRAAVDSAMEQVDASKAFRAFERMEQKIEGLEDELSAHEELDETMTLEAELEALAVDSELENELAALKERLGQDAKEDGA